VYQYASGTGLRGFLCTGLNPTNSFSRAADSFHEAWCALYRDVSVASPSAALEHPNGSEHAKCPCAESRRRYSRRVMTAEVSASELKQSNPVPERRKHPRHRYIGRADGMWFTAMTYEISAGGLSAATTTNLTVGEKVSLSPVVNKRVEAIVRRKNGSMYGFEFIGLTAQIQSKILKLCEGLPLFQSLIDA
jgi:hypothetical protein